MKLSHFFVDRPIFAAVIAIIITLVGLFSYPELPVSQFPDIAPPSVNVSVNYPGASAEILSETVLAPLEQQINGVENMLYMTSTAVSNGSGEVSVSFKPGTDLDTAQVQIQNRVSTVLPRLPEQVRNLGVTVQKQSNGFLMLVALKSTDPNVGIDYLGDWANTILRDRLLRQPGIGEIRVFGGSTYAMRIWIDPDRAAIRNLTAGDIVAALRSQNVQVAAGAIGRSPFKKDAPAFELPIQMQGRLITPEQFDNIVIKTSPDGGVTRLARHRPCRARASGLWHPSLSRGDARTIGMAVFPQPGANELASAEAVRQAKWRRRGPDFPPGVGYSRALRPDRHSSSASIEAVQHTLIEALVLVVVVILVFLQTWRAAIIPIVAIPVSLIGSMAVLLGLGIQPELAVAVRSRARGRHRGRRCDRGGRECRAQHPRGAQPARRRDPHHGRGVGRRDRDRPRAPVGVRSDGLRLRHSGPVLSPVRGHHRRRRRSFRCSCRLR